MSFLQYVLGVVAAVTLAAVGELVSDEIRARLDRIPLGVLAMAAKRLRPEHREALYVQEWLPELHHVLQGDEATPITRLIHGTRFAVSLWFSAPQVARELAPDRILARSPSTTWASLFPHGRDIFYEGHNPEGFVRQIKAEFGFSPALDPRWGERIDVDPNWKETIKGWGVLVEDDIKSFTSYCFHCPAEHLDAIYGSDRFPMGS